MRDEGFAAWVASLFGDLYHFGTNAHDLAKADLVDLFSGQISRRFLTNTKGIIGRTIWLRRNTRRLGAGWLVACCVPRQLLVQRWIHDRADGRFGVCGQYSKVGFRNIFRTLGGIRSVETRPANVGGNKPADCAFKAV